MKKLEYLPSLDGIRAIAVLIVFFSHLPLGFSSFIPGGFGVTIFFFLSGFIITTLMRLEYENTGKLSLKKFYLRRICRIFPPLYIVLTIALMAGYFNLLDSSYTTLGALSSFLHITNYYVIFFDPEVTTLLPGMDVTWSLAVEEHFYLLFPLLFVLARIRFNNRQLSRLLILICVAVLAWRFYLYAQEDFFPRRIFWGTVARFDSILYGSILALTCNPAFESSSSKTDQPNRWLVVLLVLALGTLIVTLVPRNHLFREVFRYSIQGVCLMPVFYMAVKWSRFGIFRILNTWAMRWLGRLSYSFYLCHRLTIQFCFQYCDVNPVMIVTSAFAISILFSLLMYFSVEKQMAGLRKRLHS